VSQCGSQEIIRFIIALSTMRRDGSRWSFLHEIFIDGENGTKVAQVIVGGAWLNLDSRKLGTPAPELREVMNRFLKTTSFEWIPDKTLPVSEQIN